MKRKLPRWTEVRSDINVTPLVDVCLVLLIIFMLVTPLLRQGPEVTLPETREPSPIPESARQITLTVRADGSILYGSQPLPEGELPRLLAELRAADDGRRVVVRGDTRLSYRTVRDVLHQVSSAGFPNAGLATERTPPPAS